MTRQGDPAGDAVRAGFRDWLEQAWDPDITVRAWWRRLADSGWGFPHWPREWFGLGLRHLDTVTVREQMAAAGVLGPPSGVGPAMGAPVLFAHGSDDQRRRWLPALAHGEENWCQFFSEPGAGSDLAGVSTRAVPDGRGWVVNGQKVWNSGTRVADRGLLVARTDPDVAKHRGMSYFVIDVDQPGVEVRPIRQMNGRAEFNETFFTDAHVADDARVGAVGEGFRVAMTTLSSERSTFAGGGAARLAVAVAGERAGNLDRPVGEVLAEVRGRDTSGANIPPLSDAAALIALARAHGRSGDPLVRQTLARIHATGEALRFTALRARAAELAGREPGQESSIGYLGGVRLLRQCRDAAAAIVGPAATLVAPDAPEGGDVAMTVMTVPCHGIQGGSEQIQMNIIGERILGLPKEPQVDRDIPFRAVAAAAHGRPRTGES